MPRSTEEWGKKGEDNEDDRGDGEDVKSDKDALPVGL